MLYKIYNMSALWLHTSCTILQITYICMFMSDASLIETILELDYCFSGKYEHDRKMIESAIMQ